MKTAAPAEENRRFTNIGSIDVNSIYERSAPVNTAADHEREFLTKAINSAIARARLTVNSLEAIAASLRHKQATTAEVRAWLKDEGLEKLVTRYMPGSAS